MNAWFDCSRGARRAAAAVLVLAIAPWGFARASDPQFGGTTPLGGQRGTEVEVTFGGARLADAQEILFYEPGIAVTSLEPDAGGGSVKTKLSIAPDCRLGLHQLRIRTATGITNLRTFSVGALPEIAEAEPNSEFDTPQKISLDTIVNGVADNEDVDYYAIEAKKGERITAEIEGLRLGITFFDPYVGILDSRRFELARSDDAPLVRQDCVASVVAPEDGTYIIEARETSFAGNGSCRYRLHVGRFPRPTAVLPFGGKPGEELEVQWLGDVLGPRTEKITLPGALSSDFGIFAKDDLGISPSANPFRLSELANVLEAEPNNALAEGTPAEAPVAMNGVIAEAKDVDCFKFTAKKGQVFDIRVLARAYGSRLDSVLNVYRIGGGHVAGNDDIGGYAGAPDSYLRVTIPEDDTYVVNVTDHLGQGGPDYVYRVEVTPVQPALTMGLSEWSQFVDIVAPVPQGNRMAFLVNASRADWGGDVKLEFNDLPAGVTVETLPIPANRGDVPVLLTAAADAPLAGSLVDIVGRPVDENLKIEGHLSQRTSLVRGQNNIEVWNQYSHRMATAVTNAAPFSIEIVEPKVPLVRNGSMNLKIVAKRNEGFTAPIAVRMLYNPPGVGSSGSISIAEGQNEATIPLTANSGAEVKAWKIVVLGFATVGDGTITVASPMATLDVAEPFLAFTFQAAAIEKGKPVDVVIKVEKKKDWEGPAQITLVGLPNEVTTEPKEITKDTTELVFPVKTTANSPVGKHTTLLCQALITANGEPILHTLGNGELRIDEPLPPKPDAPAQAEAKPAEAAPMPEKRLTQLEKLRLARQEAKAARAAKPAEDPKPAEEAKPAESAAAAEEKPAETAEATEAAGEAK